MPRSTPENVVVINDRNVSVHCHLHTAGSGAVRIQMA